MGIETVSIVERRKVSVRRFRSKAVRAPASLTCSALSAVSCWTGVPIQRIVRIGRHQRVVSNLGGEMSPLSPGMVQRVGESRRSVERSAEPYRVRDSRSISPAEDDEKIDIFHDRLTDEISAATMPTSMAHKSRGSLASTTVLAIMPATSLDPSNAPRFGIMGARRSWKP